MNRALVLYSCLALLPAFAKVQFLASLPNGAVSKAIQVDTSGNIYLAGSFAPQSVQDASDAFVAKLSPDGSRVIYFTALSGAQADAAVALTVTSDGSAYVAGNTSSSDFPSTPGAFQTTHDVAGRSQGFVTKVNPAGAVVNSTFINGPAFTRITGVAVDSAGNVYVTGLGGPKYALETVSTGESAQGFILKLDAALSQSLLSIYGYGGGLLSIDAQSNLYVAGTAQPNFTSGSSTLTLPPLPSGATHAARFCLTFGSGPGGPGGSVPCLYQYVAKLNASGVPIWAMSVTGTYGAIPRAMAVDSAGNVIVAGTTNSDDYPVTPKAFQTAYSAAAAPFPVAAGSSYSDPPPETGYVTKINATGTALLWSTYFGGTRSDQISGMTVSPSGDIILSGRASSSDLPALAGVPDGCRPTPNQPLGFVVRLTADGSATGSAQLVTGAPDCLYAACPISATYPSQASWPVAVRPDGTTVIAGTHGTVAAVDFSSMDRLACITDPADNAQIQSVAPGQLITLFGTDLAPAKPFTPTGGVAASTASFGVFFDGTPAPILYSAGQQINVQVPFEIAGKSSVQVQIADQQVPLGLSETHTLGVVAQQPSVFLARPSLESPFPGYTVCGGTPALGPAVLAINEDGTVNDCTNPARVGSKVTIFLNGLGQSTPALTTGVLAPSPALTLTPGVSIVDLDSTSLSPLTRTLPGAITGVSQVQFQVGQPPQPPPGANPVMPYYVTPSVAGKSTRQRIAQLWVRTS